MNWLERNVSLWLPHFRTLWMTTAWLVILMSVSARCDEQWPHYLGPNFDLKPSVEEFTAKSTTKVWETKVTTGMCSVTIAQDLLYTMGNDGTEAGEDNAKDTVYCLDAKTGEERWTFDYPCALDPRLHPGGPAPRRRFTTGRSIPSANSATSSASTPRRERSSGKFQRCTINRRNPGGVSQVRPRPSVTS